MQGISPIYIIKNGVHLVVQLVLIQLCTPFKGTHNLHLFMVYTYVRNSSRWKRFNEAGSLFLGRKYSDCAILLEAYHVQEFSTICTSQLTHSLF